MHLEANTMERAFERKTWIQGGLARRQKWGSEICLLNPEFEVKWKGLGELQPRKLIG